MYKSARRPLPYFYIRLIILPLKMCNHATSGPGNKGDGCSLHSSSRFSGFPFFINEKYLDIMFCRLPAERGLLRVMFRPDG